MTDNDEELAFWLLVGLCEGYGLEGMWSDGMPRLKLCFHVLDRMMALRTPALHAHFQVAFPPLVMDADTFLPIFGYLSLLDVDRCGDREKTESIPVLTRLLSLDAPLVLWCRSVACTWPCSAASGS